MAEQYTILGGKVHVYKRPNSSHWQCSSYLAGKNRRTSTKEDSLSKAKEIAEDWYLQLRGKLRNGEIKTEKTFREASDNTCVNTTSSRKASAAKSTSKASTRDRGHLVPFFGHGPLGNHRRQGSGLPHSPPRRSDAKRGKPPAHNTMHQEIVTLRQT
jgi:hypothetical protein